MSAPQGFTEEAWEFAEEAFGAYAEPRFYRATTPAEVGDPITADDIKAAAWVSYRDGDGEPSLSYLAELHDGRWVYHDSWHDYTGWGCRGGSDFYVGTHDEVVSHMLPSDRQAAGR